MTAVRKALSAIAIAALAAACIAEPAAAKWFGSNLADPANTEYGCESALVLGPIGGVELAPTHQTSCTYRHGGYFNSLTPTAIVPGSGWIRHIQVKSGPNPALLRVTVLTGSSRVDTFSGRDLP